MKAAVVIKWSLLVAVLIGFVVFFSLGGQQLLSFSYLMPHHLLLKTWVNQHFFYALLLFFIIYVCVVVLSVPGPLFLSIAGGYLLGLVPAFFAVLFSATLGAVFLFLIVRTTLGKWLASTVRVQSWIGKVQAEFQKNSVGYLLFLRLVPIFPFGAVNIVTGLLCPSFVKFLLTTFFGIMPGVLIYVNAGHRLNTVLTQNNTLNYNIIFQPQIFFSLLALGIFALLPVIYRYFKN